MATVLTESEAPAADDLPPASDQPPSRGPADLSRKRFTVSAIVGSAVTLPLFLWLQWDLWSGSVNPLRAVPYDNFYDLQARAMFHGRLSLPDGKMGIEAFVHNGHNYTYFGLFPSIIRMPILLVTSRLDGQLTAPSILVAWLLTGLVSALMPWRLRVLMRGDAVVGRTEAVSFGALMATIMGGSVVIYLAATPFIYNEDFAWSIPLTVGSLFALLGMLEQPSRRRAVVCGLLILCTNLDRSPPGWACCIAALLVAAWFALGRGGNDARRWAIPMVVAAAIPFLASCVVTYAKFGIPVGLPMADQVWATVNAHRRYFLAANGGKAFSFSFLPSTLWAYLQPFGIRIGSIFPFVSPPAAPASWLGGVVLDQTYPTASFTDTSPLLLLLGCWGLVTAFRPRGVGLVRLTRIILIGGAAGAGGVLLWGYISQRYLGDLMPFFIIAGGIGLIDVWRRLERRARSTRVITLSAILAVAVYCVAANVAIAAFPVGAWTLTQAENYISAQSSLSLGSLASTVQRGSTLPYSAPAGEIFAMNNCSGLYLSTGDDLKDVPGQQIEHWAWLPVEQPAADTHIVAMTFNRPPSALAHGVTVLTFGKSRLVLEQADRPGYVWLHLYNSGTSVKWPSPVGWKFPVTSQEVRSHEQFQVVVTVDPNLNRFTVKWYGDSIVINHFVAGTGTAIVKPTTVSPGAPLPAVTVSNIPLGDHSRQFIDDQTVNTNAQMTLCRSLTQNH
jgi:hypothetical protein